MSKYQPTLIKYNGKRVLTIPYEIVDSLVRIKGDHLRQARKNAGYGEAGDYAAAHSLWGGTKQLGLEKEETIELSLNDLSILIDALYKPQDAAGATKKKEGEITTPDSSDI